MEDTGVDGTVLVDCEASHFSPVGSVMAAPSPSIDENRRVSARQPASFSLRRKEKEAKETLLFLSRGFTTLFRGRWSDEPKQGWASWLRKAKKAPTSMKPLERIKR
jgi:hypothetical protein